MRDDDLGAIAILFMIMGLLAMVSSLSWGARGNSIVNECEEYGYFIHQETRYNCSEREEGNDK